jgi:hypothetical protein
MPQPPDLSYLVQEFELGIGDKEFPAYRHLPRGPANSGFRA